MSLLEALFSTIGHSQAEPPESKISDKYADVPLTNQFGKPLSFRRDFVDGRALIVTSMYTTCRGTCPTTNNTLRRIREALSPLFGKRLSIVSFTLEPKVDTPKVLLNYAKSFGAAKAKTDLCDWHFVTGQPADIEKLRVSLNFFDLDPRIDRDITQHDSILLFGNSTHDRWAAMPAALREAHLIETIRRIAGFTFEQRYQIPK